MRKSRRIAIEKRLLGRLQRQRWRIIEQTIHSWTYSLFAKRHAMIHFAGPDAREYYLLELNALIARQNKRIRRMFNMVPRP